MTSISRRKLLVGMTAATTLFAAPAIIRAQAKSLRSACYCRAPATWRRPARAPIAAP